MSQENNGIPTDAFYAPPTFENYRTEMVTTIGFLIGVNDNILDNPSKFDIPKLTELRNEENALIIRHLSILRNQLLKNYEPISKQRYSAVMPLEQMGELLNVESIRYLRERGIETALVNYKGGSNITINIAYINQYILDNVNKIKPLIPEWVKFDYIRNLFLMQGCYAGIKGSNIASRDGQKSIITKIHEVRGAFLHTRLQYPYQTYITWPLEFKETDGNILFNDAKFLKLLYGANRDIFKATEYVIDAKSQSKESIYDFVDKANQIAIFVDCENVDPYCFAAALLNLDSSNLEKIKQIVLYDDVNTSTAWDFFEKIISLPIKHNEINRVLDNKSLVDITMTAGVCEEFYKEHTESIILASSDSDFWGLITSLPLARFYVLNESRKTSPAIIEKLNTTGIEHCFMDDFAQDKVQKFKTSVLMNSLLKRINEFNESGTFAILDVEELLDTIFREACIMGADKQIQQERQVFFNTYLKRGLIVKPIEEDGRLVFKMEFNR